MFTPFRSNFGFLRFFPPCSLTHLLILFSPFSLLHPNVSLLMAPHLSRIFSTLLSPPSLPPAQTRVGRFGVKTSHGRRGGPGARDRRGECVVGPRPDAKRGRLLGAPRPVLGRCGRRTYAFVCVCVYEVVLYHNSCGGQLHDQLRQRQSVDLNGQGRLEGRRNEGRHAANEAVGPRRRRGAEANRQLAEMGCVVGRGEAVTSWRPHGSPPRPVTVAANHVPAGRVTANERRRWRRGSARVMTSPGERRVRGSRLGLPGNRSRHLQHLLSSASPRQSTVEAARAGGCACVLCRVPEALQPSYSLISNQRRHRRRKGGWLCARPE